MIKLERVDGQCCVKKLLIIFMKTPFLLSIQSKAWQTIRMGG